MIKTNPYQSDELSFKWTHKAAQHKGPDAMFLLGIMYLSGTGVADDAERGLYWIFEASKLGHSKANEFLDKTGF